MTLSVPSEALPDVESINARLYTELQRIYDATINAQKIAQGRLYTKVGQTPKETIWSLNKTKLYHYFPQTSPDRRHRIPLLLVFALINRPYIFDLRPGNSFVEYMVQQGYDIYLLDWGVPGPEDAHLKFDDFALNYLPRAIRKMQSHSASHEFSILGWCIGATLSTIYAAMRPNDGLRNLVLLTPPLDFSDKNAGPFNLWLREDYYDVDRLVQSLGNIPSEMIEWGSKMIKPVENFIGNYIKLWDNLDDPAIIESWQAMNTWVTDPVPFPGAAFRQWVVEFFRENRLMQHELMMEGKIVDLASIKANFLNVIADKDHIVPSCQSLSVMDHIGSVDRQLMVMKGGHIGVMAGSGARKRVWPQIDTWLELRSS